MSICYLSKRKELVVMAAPACIVIGHNESFNKETNAKVNASIHACLKIRTHDDLISS